MATLQSTGGFSRIKDQSEAEEGSLPANWPSDSLAHGLLIAIGVFCVVLIGGGFGILSWQVIEERNLSSSHHRNNHSHVIISNNHHQGDSAASSNHDDDRIMHWPVLTESPTDKPKRPPTTTRVPEPSATDAELSQIAQRLWDADSNRFPDGQYTLHLQGHTNQSETVDRANRRLFNSMNADPVTWSGTYTRFVSLLDNYEVQTRRVDEYTLSEKSEIDGFLDEILKTEVVRYLEDFLMRKGYISHQMDSLRQLLKSLWFEMYNRSPRYNTTDSSGFEHVFAGEIKKNKVTGFHSWVRFYLEERDGNIDYQGYISYDSVGGSKRRVSINRERGRQRLPPGIINVRMNWRGKPKKQAAFFMGTSPEFDISVYTLCILARTNEDCNLTINQSEVPIKTFDISHVPGLQVGSAFPAI